MYIHVLHTLRHISFIIYGTDFHLTLTLLFWSSQIFIFPFLILHRSVLNCFPQELLCSLCFYGFGNADYTMKIFYIFDIDCIVQELGLTCQKIIVRISKDYKQFIRLSAFSRVFSHST